MPNESEPGQTSSSASEPPRPQPRDALAADFAANANPGGPVYSDQAPIIKWEGGELPRIVDEAEEALIGARLQLYQRGSTLVRVVRRQALSTRDFKRPAGALGIVTVDMAYLTEAMTRAAHWERFDKRSDSMKRINAPAEVARTYLSRVGHWRLPPLLACISAPTLRPDGSLLQRPGYDADMATYFDPCGVAFPEVPEQPDREQAEGALKFLRSVFATFPFVRETGENESVDEAVFIAAMLQALVRRSLDCAPLAAISATVMESGKSLLARCISLIATGVGPTIMRYPETNEEAAKLALSVLMGGESVVLLDNVDRPLEGDWLCIILTEEKYSGRMLGSLETIEVPTATTWLATGNGLVVSGDLRTRTLLCRIDPQVERPGARHFDTDLNDWIPKHRAQLVAAGLTVMRAYQVADIDPRHLVPSWDRYKRWSSMVREPLVWLGMADPCESLRLLEKDDPKRVELLRLLTEWERRYGDKPLTASEVIKDAIAVEDRVYKELIGEIAGDRGGDLRPRKLASYLSHNAGRIVNGMKFEKKGEHDGTTLWRVTKLVH